MTVLRTGDLVASPVAIIIASSGSSLTGGVSEGVIAGISKIPGAVGEEGTCKRARNEGIAARSVLVDKRAEGGEGGLDWPGGRDNRIERELAAVRDRSDFASL